MTMPDFMPMLLGAILIFLGLAMLGMRAGYWVFVVGIKTVVALAVVATVGAWLIYNPTRNPVPVATQPLSDASP
jgi:hypothetical protein